MRRSTPVLQSIRRERQRSPIFYRLILAELAAPLQSSKAAEEECRQRGSEVLEINVDGEDTDARRFYERHGYTNHEPGQTEPELYYHRDLAARSAT